VALSTKNQQSHHNYSREQQGQNMEKYEELSKDEN